MRGWQRAAVGLVVVAALAGGQSRATPVAASSLQNVDVYVQLASVSPAAGCIVDLSVEVRSGGYAIPNTEVVLGLVVGGELASADRALTGEDGIAFLALDTGGGWAGADSWLDVNISGTYVGGRSIALTESGPCSGDSELWTVSHQVWLPDPNEAAAIAASAAESVSVSNGIEMPASGASIWVPTYFQQRNLSCEYAALTIATGAFNNWVSEYTFENLTGWSVNPHWGYRGDINGAWGNTVDYGVYAEALVWPLSQVGFYGEVFYGQGDASALQARLDRGMPTLVWIGLWGDLSVYEYTDDGTAFKLTPGAHVVVAYGYDAGGLWVSDPALGDYRYYDWGTFMWMWNVLDGMALAVAPA
jgi:uncharacterized protein YvpB